MAQPLQIIVTGDSETDYFLLRDENLSSIVARIPADAKVSIVSVVGAFRTGKSFLLNFFLRYLRHPNPDESSAWMVAEGDELAEGNMNEGGWNLVDGSQVKEESGEGVDGESPTLSKKEASFQWRGGQERQTTGIWMWSEPFIRTNKHGEKLAVLLMDTQGMFDNETTMTLTAQIFGISTLVSSFQIYNVDKRIQEDNLQHLALFSEYGRMALLPSKEEAEQAEAASAKDGEAATPVSQGEESPTVQAASVAKKVAAPAAVDDRKPFQHLQFLVRDWQNFDTEYEEGNDDSVFEKLRGEMQKYLTEVLRARGLSDLASTREQITRCFEHLDCFMLPHPGFAVTKKNFDGSIAKIDPAFRALINKYVRHVFVEELEAKLINNRKLSGKELHTYFEVYVKMFQAGQKTFPKAMTMLDATAEANNRNAYDSALHTYKQAMEGAAGADKPFMKEDQLQAVHDAAYIAAFEQFDELANMGAAVVIEKMRNQLKAVVESEKERYFTTNGLRNPFKDAELYILPMGIAAVAWFLAVIVNATCSTDFCEDTEDTFVNIYLFVFFGIIVLAWRHIQGAVMYAKEVLPLLLHGAGAGGSASEVAANIVGGLANKSKQKTN